MLQIMMFIYATPIKDVLKLIMHWWINFKAIGYEGPKTELNELKLDTQSQKVILQLDTPVIGKIYSNTLGICNNERFNIIGI